MSGRDAVHKRLSNEIAMEQYNYDLLREKVNNELENRNKERKVEINKQITNAQRELQERLINADDKVLRQLEDKKNLAEIQRKKTATKDLRQQALGLQKQKIQYYKLIQQDSRLTQIVNDFRNNSEIQHLKEQAVLKDLEVKRQRLIDLIAESKLREQTLMNNINDLQSQL